MSRPGSRTDGRSKAGRGRKRRTMTRNSADIKGEIWKASWIYLPPARPLSLWRKTFHIETTCRTRALRDRDRGTLYRVLAYIDLLKNVCARNRVASRFRESNRMLRDATRREKKRNEMLGRVKRKCKCHEYQRHHLTGANMLFEQRAEITRLRLSQSAVPPADNWRRGNDFRWAGRERNGSERRRGEGSWEEKDTRINTYEREREKGANIFVRHLRLAAARIAPDFPSF